MVPVIREFDGSALFAALDARRRAEGLSWPAAAAAIWNTAPALNAARDARGLANHPISTSALQTLGRRGNTTCQHALFFLRWLERSPESFLEGATPGAGAPLPACGAGRHPRWDLKALHAALNDARTGRGATWAQTARELRCQPGPADRPEARALRDRHGPRNADHPVDRPAGRRLHLPGALVGEDRGWAG
jgi:hypothetical protein